MGLLGSQTQQQYYSNSNNFGDYQFVSLADIISGFMVAYVGENKLISKVNRTDVVFHAKRALQELSFDTFKSCKSHEVEIPASLTMILPQDYVNYTKISWVDSSGIKHRLYPTLCNTSNPFSPQIDDNGEYLFQKNIMYEDDDPNSTTYGDMLVGTLNENLIPAGNLLKNGNFLAGSNGWILNETGWSGGTVATQTSSLDNNGDPQKGWHYGFDGNAIGGYDLSQYQGIRQLNVPIVSGEKYTVTYTISNYTGGSYNVQLNDENGDSKSTTQVSANGTYTETLTMDGSNAQSYPAQSVQIRNQSSTSGNIVIDNISIVRVGDEDSSTTWGNYSSATPSENNNDDYEDDIYWPNTGERYGLDPQHAQANGSFFIDCDSGKIHFSSNISGKTVILEYISDSLGTDDEMKVHKFAEEAMYKWILCSVMSARQGVPEYAIRRYKKDKFAETRKAKIRLSNIKIEEITQVLRGKSKQIKH
jgi:hypothetical protein